jgi:hypothetical protein
MAVTLSWPKAGRDARIGVIFSDTEPSPCVKTVQRLRLGVAGSWGGVTRAPRRLEL